MKIDRTALQIALKTAKPALAAKSPILQFMYYWFDGERITAYNDVLGISAPCKTDFMCGISGTLLSGFVDNSRAKTADLSLDGSEVVLKLASAKARLAALPAEQRVWEFPTVSGKKPLTIDEDLVFGFEHLQLSASEYGVCFASEDKKLSLYSSNRRATSWYYTDQPFDKTIVVPAEFCGQVAAMATTGKLYFMEGAVAAILDNGVGIFSRLLDGKPLPYREALDRLLGKASKGVAIPTFLKLSLNRVGVLEGDEKILKSEYKVADGKLYISAKTQVGDLAEIVPLEGKHASQEAFFDSALIRKGIDKLDTFFFTSECFVMEKGDAGAAGYVVAALV